MADRPKAQTVWDDSELEDGEVRLVQIVVDHHGHLLGLDREGCVWSHLDKFWRPVSMAAKGRKNRG